MNKDNLYYCNCKDCINFPEKPAIDYCIENKIIPKIGNIVVCKYYKLKEQRNAICKRSEEDT